MAATGCNFKALNAGYIPESKAMKTTKTREVM